MSESEQVKNELSDAVQTQAETAQTPITKNKRQRIAERVIKDIKALRWPLFAIIVYMIPTELIFHTTCPLAIMTGLPCPGCGITRALLLVLRFRFVEAAQMNFTVYLWIAIAIFFVIYRYFLEKDRFPNAIFIPVGLIMIGLWLYRMITVFPGPAPMEYRQFNIFSLIVQTVEKSVNIVIFN